MSTNRAELRITDQVTLKRAKSTLSTTPRKRISSARGAVTIGFNHVEASCGSVRSKTLERYRMELSRKSRANPDNPQIAPLTLRLRSARPSGNETPSTFQTNKHEGRIHATTLTPARNTPFWANPG